MLLKSDRNIVTNKEQVHYMLSSDNEKRKDDPQVFRFCCPTNCNSRDCTLTSQKAHYKG